MDISMAFSLMPLQGGYSQRYCTREWEEQKSTIYKLYIEEGQKLKAVLKILSESGFVVTYFDLFSITCSARLTGILEKSKSKTG
jgi:hypothetical protein